MNVRNIFLVLVTSYLSVAMAFGQVTLPKLISDGMVLQRDTPLKIWGWAKAGEKVKLEFRGKKYSGVTDKTTRWAIALPSQKSGGPFEMKITGTNEIILHNVLVGDVWFCSGQSNMVLTMERVKEKYPDEITAANYPMIRNFFIPTSSDVAGPHSDLPPGIWNAVTPKSVLTFGAVAYYFAKSVYQKHQVPVGIINSSVGGTPIEAWISENGIKQFPKYANMIENFRDTSFMNTMLKSVNAPIPAQDVFPSQDRGRSGPIAWSNPAFVPKGWKDFWLPGYWEDQGVRGLNGIIWFRKEIEVPASMTGKPAKLFLGRIIDADSAFVNGVFTGSITYQYPPRRYELQPGVLKPGKNVIVVRVVSQAGKGGFVPDKPYYLTAGGENIDLKGQWKYQVGQVLIPREKPLPTRFSAQNSPTGLYNTMVAPTISYSIKGFAWYQGETNAGRPEEYEELLPALIRDWRSKWNLGELPFLYVQLPDFMEVQYLPSESHWARLRESQRKALTIPGTAMVVTLGLGEWNDIHPLSKKEIGERLALAAEHLAYQNNTVVYAGPSYQSHTIEGNKIILTFNHTGGGLTANGDNELRHFAISGIDKKFVWAKAKIEGNKVIVWNDRVSDPKFVRYAWADNPEGANLCNKEGLPASPFETNP